MARFEDTIEVEVPVRVAYDQWTQFREFPKFMDGVESVNRLDDRRSSGSRRSRAGEGPGG